jgi:hypothetical protein
MINSGENNQGALVQAVLARLLKNNGINLTETVIREPEQK